MGVQIGYYIKFVLPCFLLNVLHLENMDGLEPGDGLHPDGSSGDIVHGAYDILKIPSEVYDLLEKNNIFNGIKRAFGQFIYTIIDSLLSMEDAVFKALLSFDFDNIEVIKGMDIRLTEIAFYVMTISITIVLLLNLIRLKDSLPVLYNICLASFCISAFVPIVNFMQEIQHASLVSVDYIAGTAETDNLSDTVFKSNTIDLVQTMKTCSDQGDVYACEIRNIDPSASANYIEYDMLLDSDIVGDSVKSYTIENGQERRVREKMSDGVFGIGKERYYAFYINYFCINTTCLVLMLIYFLGLFKMAYLLSEEIQIIITAKPVMAMAVNDVKRIGLVFTSLIKNFAGQVLVYFTMCFFGIVTSAMGTNNLTGNWLADAIIMFGIGMAFLVGSTYLNNALGIDDGSGYMMKSLFAMGRLGKMFKPIKRGLGKLGNKFGGEINDLKEEYQDGKDRSNLAGITEESLKGSSEEKYQEEEMLKQQGDIPEEERVWKDGTRMTDEEYREQKLSDPNYVNKWHELQDVKNRKVQEKEQQHLEQLDRKAEEQRAMNQFRHDQWREQGIKDGKIKDIPKYKDLENLSLYEDMKKENPELEYRPAPKNFSQLYKLSDEEQEQFKSGNWEEYETNRIKEVHGQMMETESLNSDNVVVEDDDVEENDCVREINEWKQRQKEIEREEAEMRERKQLMKKFEYSNFINGMKGNFSTVEDTKFMKYALQLPKEKQCKYTDMDSIRRDYENYKGGNEND